MRRGAGVAAGLTSALALLAACATTMNGPDRSAALALAEEPLRALLAGSKVAPMLSGADERRIQIVLGLVEPGPDGRPKLRQAGFRAGAEYFYPASSIKFFAAIAALEKLSDLRRETGLPIDRDTALELFPLFEGEKLEQRDATHVAGGTITVGHEIRKLAVVSDNEAFNRLYELVGQDGIATSLARAGLGETRIVHRLDELRSPEDNRRYPRTDFVGPTFRHTIAERSSPALQPPPPLPKLLVGTGFLSNETLVAGPMDFSGKNRIALADLQRGLCKLVLPGVDCGGGAAFALEEDDRAFLVEAMSMLPGECPDPQFDPAEHPEEELKLFLSGLRRVQPREAWRFVDKTGWAYGFSVENAYIEDRESGRALFLAATIYTNADGVLNDDKYEYTTVAHPFFTALGEAAAKYLTTR